MRRRSTPGYGFLSENAAFAQACADAGLIFVGPPARSIAAMGSKILAKTRMQGKGVPVLPGYAGEQQDLAHLKSAALAAGLPLIVKPAAGGGGKGMQIIREPSQIEAALAAARRLAESAFGDGALLLERFLAAPRHIEVQVFADTHGNFVHLGDRDCSIQRRHQKLIEEAPAPAVPEALRARMRAAALVVAREIGYVGAGTVEFLFDGTEFYFMEMNTRLQVEHTVTEAITGLDLVEWQLRVAAGEALPLTQEAVRFEGHAIEARVCAEDPRARLPAQRRPACAPGVAAHAGHPRGCRLCQRRCGAGQLRLTAGQGDRLGPREGRGRGTPGPRAQPYLQRRRAHQRALAGTHSRLTAPSSRCATTSRCWTRARLNSTRRRKARRSH